MKWIDAEAVAKAAPHEDVIEALRKGFCEAITAPVRHHHATGPATTLLLMPAWSKDWTGLKTLTLKSDNDALGLPAIQAVYTLIDNATGTPVVMMDATELTRRRTAGTSALAADYLARPDAGTLVLFGAGSLAPHFALAHAAVRPIKTVLIVNRTRARAEQAAAEIAALGFAARAAEAEEAVKQADIISCMTSSVAPLFKGAWLRPGTHIDLVGAYTPKMRETDAEAVARSEVYVDTHEVARAEAGDLIQAEAEGKFSFDCVKGDLAELCGGKVKGRGGASEITLFKSCGAALEDLVAAELVYRKSA
ncbi:MAG: ornithine cyclodeaminase family protein [Hyphomicrobiales bacterium]